MTPDVGPGYQWGERLPTLRGRGVVLRWLTAGDVPALYAVFADEEVNRYWDGWRMASIADADWGKGLAGDAASTLIRFAFQELGLQRIE